MPRQSPITGSYYRIFDDRDPLPGTHLLSKESLSYAFYTSPPPLANEDIAMKEEL